MATKNVDVILDRDPGRGGSVAIFLWVFSGSADTGWTEKYRTGFSDASVAELQNPATRRAKDVETAAGDGNPLRLAAGTYVAISVSMVRRGVNGLCGYRVRVGGTMVADRLALDIGTAHSDSLRDEVEFTVS